MDEGNTSRDLIRSVLSVNNKLGNREIVIYADFHMEILLMGHSCDFSQYGNRYISSQKKNIEYRT
jgi:hypothetical protein